MRSNPTQTRYLFSTAGAALVLSAPPSPSFRLAEGQAERDAELLVAGHYPAKGLKVTEQDIDDIVAAFAADTVPIKVEHVDSPLDPLGLVAKLWRDGRKLMGTIAFDPLAAPLIAKRAVRGLSVGLDRVGGRLCLSEVSLVLRPHVPSAGLLSEDEGDGLDRSEGDGLDRSLDRVARLESKLAALDADARIRALKRAGRLVPAAEAHARLLLSCADGGAAVTLADGSRRSVADTTFALLSALPPGLKFAETAATKPGADGTDPDDLYGDADDGLPELTPDQRRYCVDVLKVDPARVREAMKDTTRIGTGGRPKARA